MYRITIKLLKYAHISSHVGRTCTILFTCIINSIQKKKTSNMHTSFSHHIHFHRYFWSVNMYTIHKTTYNITTTKEITNTKFLSTR